KTRRRKGKFFLRINTRGKVRHIIIYRARAYHYEQAIEMTDDKCSAPLSSANYQLSIANYQLSIVNCQQALSLPIGL
ncbi:hypothetical protein, partial [uncultured Bacteroides sp.]|uniref:hypothetical protein n=1 Tax=uncultured Bacteroides sp. TaxID=162156 RepID=UPI00261E661C